MKPSLLQNERSGKLVLIGMSILLWLVILILMRTVGYEETWHLWSVPTERLPFSDFRLIPGSAESFLKGFEPSVENPFDPYKRIFNYPTFWRIFFYSGLTQDDTVWISIGMIVLFFIAAFAFPEGLSPADALIMLLVLFSPASMLLYERANVDLIIFFACVLILLVQRYSPYLAAAGIVVAAVMKMFPFFGVSILLKEPRNRFLGLSFACLLVFGVYFYLTLDSAKAAWNLTMRGGEISYGANVFFSRYALTASGQALVQYGPTALAMLVILAAVWLALAQPQPLPSSSYRNLAAFRMGASIYIGTFLLGNNWDYRLAFLVLVVPQVLEWMRHSSKIDRSVSVIVLVAVLASCWHFVFWFGAPFIPYRSVWFGMDEFFNWMLVAGFSYLLFRSVPDWLRSMFFRRDPVAQEDRESRHSALS